MLGMKMCPYSFDFDIPDELTTTNEEVKNSYNAVDIREQIANDIKSIEFEDYILKAFNFKTSCKINNELANCIRTTDQQCSSIKNKGNITQFEFIVCERIKRESIYINTTIDLVIEETLLKMFLVLKQFLDLDEEFFLKNDFTLKFENNSSLKLISYEVKDEKLILIVENFIYKMNSTEYISIERVLN